LILLDTHALLWWQGGGARLSAAARRAVESADRLLVSPVSFWEVCVLARKGRIELDRDTFVWIQELLASDRLETAPLSPIAAVTAGMLPEAGFPGDLADALIYATAIDLATPLVTKDHALRIYASQQRTVRTIW
jgi:PIN domain nuclease of toxin-antitoxin system